MPNRLAGLIEILQADAATAALVEERVYGEEIPAAELKNMPRRCLVLRTIQGLPSKRSHLELVSVPFILFAFGENVSRALETLDAARLALRQAGRQVAGSFLFHSANESAAPVFVRDEATKWAYYSSPWDCLMSETEVTQ